jgi:hypothetical protein
VWGTLFENFKGAGVIKISEFVKIAGVTKIGLKKLTKELKNFLFSQKTFPQKI